MVKKLLDGATIGTGIVSVLAVAIVIAWAGDVFTVDKDGVPKFAVSDAGKITVGATESYVNLVIQNNSGAANNKIDITADVLTVEGIRIENVNVSADIAASGAGGLDTGSESANTWYYVWVITNNTGASTNGLLSTSSTSPTMPSGHTKRRRVGAVRNDGSSNFLRFVQEGNKCNFITPGATTRILSNGTAATATLISASPFIPSTSYRGEFRVFVQGTATAGTTLALYVAKPGVSGSQIVAATVTAVGSVGARGDMVGVCETSASQGIEYSVPYGGGGYVDVLGYYDRI
ncbi:MAG: hypothetical protein A2Z34_11575 [Planctomycetes bacterium RBG_16_59_8]|nr:MAG: hypothetical protein A2Z34_11575 [Planctomycetes bacterium RBG_16_59_8]